jgi:thymidylate synthase
MKDIDIKYKRKLWQIYRQPEFISKPRNLKCYEVLNDDWSVDMDDPVITLPERKLSYDFMMAEAAWMLEGRNDVETVSKFANSIKRFSDNGITFYGAYGPKIIDQWPYVLDALEKDRNTRQAVINIWRENPRSSLDVPCTLSLQFFLREASDELWLHTTATMRSNDVWLGTPYDTFNFSAISFYLCLLLNQRGLKCKLGKLTIQAGSRHLYETDAHKLDNVLISTHNENRIFSMNDLIHRYKNRPNSFIKALKRASNFSFKKAEYKMRILHSG